jgi:hypothetical protein
LIRYECGSWQNFRDREWLLTTKLLNQWFLVLPSWSNHFESFTVTTITYFIVYLCHKWPRICSECT